LILNFKYVHFVVLCDVISEFSRTEDKIQSAVRYPSDLTDEEWEILSPSSTNWNPNTIGRPRKSDLREILRDCLETPLVADDLIKINYMFLKVLSG